MQLAVEIERLSLTLGGADTVPKRADLLDPFGRRREVAGIGRQPIVELAVEGSIRLVAHAPADRVGEPRDRAGIGARQTSDDRIDQGAYAFRFWREPPERLANRSVR